MLLYPGRFSPIHNGHLITSKHAEQYFNENCVFELSRSSFDKNYLSDKEVKILVNQFKERDLRYVVDENPYFWQKAATYGPCIFVVGYDTLQRIIWDNPHYSPLGPIEHYECKFAVYPRYVGGELKSLRDCFIGGKPLFYEHRFNKLFIDMSKTGFTPVNISSTELRNKIV